MGALMAIWDVLPVTTCKINEHTVGNGGTFYCIDNPGYDGMRDYYNNLNTAEKKGWRSL